MNEIVNRFLLAEDKFMLEMLLKNQNFLIMLVVHLLKTKKRLKNLCKQEIQIIFTRTIWIKLVQHDMAYDGYKDLVKRTESDEVLRDKTFKIASNPKYDGYERGLASMVYKGFDKKSVDSDIKSMSNQQLADEIHKSIIKIFKRCKVYSSFKDSIWGSDLADMQLIS